MNSLLAACIALCVASSPTWLRHVTGKRRHVVTLACGSLVLLCGVAGDWNRWRSELDAAEYRSHQLDVAMARQIGHQEGMKAYAAKNRKELEVIDKAQKAILRAREQNSVRQDHLGGGSVSG